jgi:branched-chain amino acid transport system substrate-binding protein
MKHFLARTLNTSFFCLFSASLVAVSFCANSLQADSSPSPAKPAKRSILVGGIFDLSAAGKDFGIAEKNGVLLAIDDFHKRQSKIEIKLQVEDSRYSSNQAVTAFQKLTSIDKAQFILGPTWEVCAATVPLCESSHTLCLFPSCNSGLFGASELRFSYSFWFDDLAYGSALANFAKENKLQRTALVSATSAYHERVSTGFLDALPSAPEYDQRVDPSTKDFRSLIAKMPAKLDALAVFLLGDGSLQAFLRQWAELRPERPVLLSDDALLYAKPAFDLKAAGFPAAHCSQPSLDQAAAQVFATKYKQRFNAEPPAPSAAIAYDAASMLFQCLEFHEPAQPADIAACIESISLPQGASGAIGFSGEHQLRSRVVEVGSCGPLVAASSSKLKIQS